MRSIVRINFPRILSEGSDKRCSYTNAPTVIFEDSNLSSVRFFRSPQSSSLGERNERLISPSLFRLSVTPSFSYSVVTINSLVLPTQSLNEILLWRRYIHPFSSFTLYHVLPPLPSSSASTLITFSS